MRKLALIVFLFAFVLAACTSLPTQTVQAPASSTPAVVEPTLPVGQTVPAEPTAATEPTATAAQPAPPAGVVVYKIVPGESFVTYEVGETFFNDNNRFNLAVGKTSQVSGEISVDAANPQNSKVSPLEIDISQFQSDSSRRDGFIHGRFLESSKYPLATFTPTSIEGLPSSYTAGQELTFKITGDLKVKEVTKPVTFDVTAKADGNVLSGTATTTILMSDFGVGPITLAGILGTEDKVKLTIAFVARP
jgi:polyisoprenoid-binding protein YceI